MHCKNDGGLQWHTDEEEQTLQEQQTLQVMSFYCRD